MTFSSLLLLYVLFRVKHFACDFLLQTDWMALTKGKPGREGYSALFTHSAIHAIGTVLIVAFFAPALWWLGLVDFVIHSVIDRIKGWFTYRMGWTPRDTVFWWTLGADQEAHNFTHLAYIVVIYLYMNNALAI
jgi:hypothetical protein